MGQRNSIPNRFVQNESSHEVKRRHSLSKLIIEKNQIDDHIEHYIFKYGDNSTTFTFTDFIHTIKSGNQMQHQDFLNKMISVFQETKFKAYFLECPPVSNISAQDQNFEFVLIASHELFSRIADPLSFSKYFNTNALNHSVISFQNLGKDAVLVVPVPLGHELNKYTHLANFMRGGDVDQVYFFWKVLGESLESLLQKGKKVWLSTSGLGVSWLHARLDSVPKYYNYEPYKNTSR